MSLMPILADVQNNSARHNTDQKPRHSKESKRISIIRHRLNQTYTEERSRSGPERVNHRPIPDAEVTVEKCNLAFRGSDGKSLHTEGN